MGGWGGGGRVESAVIMVQDSYLGLWNRRSSFSGLGAGFLSSHVSVGDFGIFDDHDNLSIHPY